MRILSVASDDRPDLIDCEWDNWLCPITRLECAHLPQADKTQAKKTIFSLWSFSTGCLIKTRRLCTTAAAAAKA